MFKNKCPHKRKAYVNKQGKMYVERVKTKRNCNRIVFTSVKQEALVAPELSPLT